MSARETEKSGKELGQALDPPSEKNFAAHLQWHLRVNGTRPSGRPHVPGVIWEDKDFIAEIDRARGQRVRGDLGKNLRGWLKGRRCYKSWLPLIEEVLFGQNPEYATWRVQLRLAHAERTIERDDLERKTDGKKIAESKSSDVGTQKKLDLILEALGPRLEEISHKGITETSLRLIASRIDSQLREASIDEILRCIENFVTNALEREKKNAEPSVEFPELSELCKAADVLVKTGRLDELSGFFDEEIDRRRRTLPKRGDKEIADELAIIQHAAEYDLLVVDVHNATRHYIEYCTIIFPEDIDKRIETLELQSEILIHDGTNEIDIAKILTALNLLNQIKDWGLSP